MEKEYCIITTVCNKKEIADKIIETLLEKRLVYCCQVININSSYWWKGKIEREPEFFIQMKTKKTLKFMITKLVRLYLMILQMEMKSF